MSVIIFWITINICRFESLKMNKKSWIVILCFLSFNVAFGQNKYYLKAEKYYEAAKYSKALSNLEKAKKDGEINKAFETYLLESKIWLGINETQHLPDAPKNAVKSAIKAKEKANSLAFIEDNKEHFILISKINNTEAIANYNDGRYSKAIPLFKRGIELNDDPEMEFLLANSYIKNNDPRMGMPILENVLIKQFDNYIQEKPFGTFSREGFDIYTSHLVQNNFTDSAELFLSMGLSLFPNDVNMLDKQRIIWYQRMNEIPLSDELFAFLDNASQTYPLDSAFTFKKNGVYLTFINNNIKTKHFLEADSWLERMMNEKILLNGSQPIPTAKNRQEDFFLASNKATILKKMIFYFGNFSQLDAENYLFSKYVKANYGTDDNAYINSLNDLKVDYPAGIVANLYEYAIVQTKSNAIKADRLKWYKYLMIANGKKSADFDALLKINTSMAKSNNDKALQKDRLQILSDYWNINLVNKDFWRAYELGFQFDKEFPNNLLSDSMWRKTIALDFDDSYYGTRIQMKTPADKPFGFTWNGSIADCNPGYLPDSILFKVAVRINYFRRIAGLNNPIALIENFNKACQNAVLFYAANKNLSHDLNEAMSCYSYDADEAAKFALLTQGVHTSIAITEFMNDNNKTAGNRRWFLYPPTRFMGFGCTDFQSALWCVNDQKNWDTSAYISNFVAWPPAGYSPKMFAFKNWTFSAYQDFNGATVKMTNLDSKAEIPCTINETVIGYGMPTLVWQPNTNFRTESKDTKVKVEIKLKNGKTFSYITNLIDYKK